MVLCGNIMGYKQYGCAFVCNLTKAVQYDSRILIIEITSGLVCENELWFRDERTCDSNPFYLTARKLGRHFVCQIVNIKHFQ